MPPTPERRGEGKKQECYWMLSLHLVLWQYVYGGHTVTKISEEQQKYRSDK